MSVWKIALGVLLGNIAFALIMWFAVSVIGESNRARVGAQQAHERLEAIERDSPSASNAN